MHEAILHLSLRELSELGLGELVDHLTTVGLHRLSEFTTHGSRVLYYVVTEEPVPPGTLDAIPSLVWWTRLRTDTEAGVYLCTVTPPDESAVCSLIGHVNGDGADSESEIEISVIGPATCLEQSPTLSTASEWREPAAYLDRLTTPSGQTTPLSSLTDRQREILQLAFEMGYYEVPRTASSEDIATRVSLDPSTVAEHLQRAERNLLGDLLG